MAFRHLQAIKNTRNALIVAVYLNDSMGVIYRHLFEASFSKEFEPFDRHKEKLRST